MKAIFEPMVKPEMLSSFFENWEKWFVLSDKVEDLRKPGLLKPEFEFSSGRFIALGCKSYTGFNADTGETKRGTKGVPHRIPIELVNFRDCLYKGQKYRIKLENLQKDKDHKMCRFSREKIGLTDIFVKSMIADDRISCTPIRLNGKLL